MYILGINSVYHESSACLLKDGQVVAAIEEERLNRIKHAKKALYSNPHYLPYNAIAFCLKQAGITFRDLDHIGYSFVPDERLAGNICGYDNLTPICRYRRNSEELLFYSLLQLTESCLTAENAVTASKKLIEQMELPDTLEGLRENTKFHFVNHHLCYAASAFYPSGFTEAAIMTVDGIGENATTWLGIGCELDMSCIKTLSYPNSLGFLFERFTEFLGFQKNSDEYKVAGLSSYGEQDPEKNRYYKLIKDNIIELLSDGGFGINNQVTQFRQPLNQSGMEKLFGPARKFGSSLELCGRHADIAAGLQTVINEAVLHCAKYLAGHTGMKSLAYAGGLALNCVTNMELFLKTPFSSIFIQPAANDAGTAMGAAFYIYHKIICRKKRHHIKDVFFGTGYTNNQIESQLKYNKLNYRRSNDIAADTAGFLAQNKVVAWFQGKMEWGPRALGNRSILGNPVNPSMKDWLNEIKGREDFRPLSPSVLEEKQAEWFAEDLKSPYMLFAFSCRKDVVAGKKRTEWIPSALHVDGTARLQTVSATETPLYHRMIKKFALLTEQSVGIPGGIPMVINTSFNAQGSPIVATIDDAVRCFFTEPIDVLVIGNFVLEKGE